MNHSEITAEALAQAILQEEEGADPTITWWQLVPSRRQERVMKAGRILDRLKKSWGEFKGGELVWHLLKEDKRPARVVGFSIDEVVIVAYTDTQEWEAADAIPAELEKR